MTANQYQILAEGIDELRESVKAMVAGLMSDGFTEQQAREIVTAVFVNVSRGPHEPV